MKQPSQGESFNPMKSGSVERSLGAAIDAPALRAAQIRKQVERAEKYTPVQKAKEAIKEENLAKNAADKARGAANRAVKAAESALPVSDESTHDVSFEAAQDEEVPHDEEEQNIEGGESLAYFDPEDEEFVLESKPEQSSVISNEGDKVAVVSKKEVEPVKSDTTRASAPKAEKAVWGANEFLRKNLVKSADSFEDLFSVLKSFKTVNHSGIAFDTSRIISEIEAILKLPIEEQIKAFEKAPTDVLGIREKSIELLKGGAKTKSAAASTGTPVASAAITPEVENVTPLTPSPAETPVAETPVAGTSTGTEKTKTKTSAEVSYSTTEVIDMGDFSIDDALNTKGAIEFLSQYPDASSHMDDPLWVFTRIEARKKKDRILADIAGTIGKIVEAEIGIKIEAADLADVSEVINGKLRENPEELFKMARILETSKTVTERVDSLEQSIEQFAGSSTFAELKRERGVLALAHKRSSFNVIGRMWEKVKWGSFSLGTESVPTDAVLLASQDKNTPSHLLHTAYREAREKYNVSNKADIESRIAGLNAHVDVVEKNQALQANLSELRERIIEDIIGEGTFASLVAKKVEQKVSKMTTSTKGPSVKDIGNIDNAVAYLQTLKADKSFEYADYVDIDSLEEKLKGQAQSVAASVLERAVTNIKMGSKVLEAFEKSLVDIVVRESIGSREGNKQVLTFVVETLESIAGKLTNTPDDRAKKIIVQRTVVKLNSLNS